MLTPKHSKYEMCRPINNIRLGPVRGSHLRAFTLIELLVVIAIIALLISILLPSLQAARGQAKKVKCGALMRDQGSGLQMYFSEGNGWIPGMNTTGVRTVEQRYDMDYHHSDIPVHRWDWLTPLADYMTKLPERRARRFHFLFEYWKCPSVPEESTTLFYESAPPDLQEFEDETAPLLPVSYLMPAYFQAWGQRSSGTVIGYYRRNGSPDQNARITAYVFPSNYEVVVEDYLSIVDRVGTPAEKIAVSDGTRYLPENNILDVDIHPWEGRWGGFADQGGWWQGGTALGVGRNDRTVDGRPIVWPSPSDGENQKWSYRHGGARDVREKSINSLFFDNHVESLTNRESREIRYWYPKGAVVKKPNEGMTLVPMDYVVP